MKANSFLPMLLALTACGAEATPGNGVAGSENRSPAAASTAAIVAPQPEDWAGEYEGQGGGGNSIIIRSTGNNRYSVWMDTFNTNGCGGEVEGGAVVSKGQLVMTTPIPDDSGRVCRMTLTRTGKTLRAEEGPDCSYFHGMSCEFRGIFTRKAGAQSSPSGATELGAGRSYMEEGGAVGCPNGPVKGHAARVADRISANDECGDGGDTASVNGPSWANGELYSAVRAREDPTYFIQHVCTTDSRGRSDGFSIGRGDPDQGTNSLTSDGRKFLTALGTKIRSAELQIFVPGQLARIMKFEREIEPDADWGFNSWADKATLAAIKKASHYRLQLSGRTLTFSGNGAAQTIAATYCQQDFHN